MKVYNLTLAAEEDLLGIWHDTFDKWGFKQAENYFDQIEACCEAVGNGQTRSKRECHELCVSGLAHAGFRYSYALKRSSNMIAKWLRAANHSRTFRPPFSKLRIAR